MTYTISHNNVLALFQLLSWKNVSKLKVVHLASACLPIEKYSSAECFNKTLLEEFVAKRFNEFKTKFFLSIFFEENANVLIRRRSTPFDVKFKRSLKISFPSLAEAYLKSDLGRLKPCFAVQIWCNMTVHYRKWSSNFFLLPYCIPYDLRFQAFHRIHPLVVQLKHFRKVKNLSQVDSVLFKHSFDMDSIISSSFRTSDPVERCVAILDRFQDISFGVFISDHEKPAQYKIKAVIVIAVSLRKNIKQSNNRKALLPKSTKRWQLPTDFSC